MKKIIKSGWHILLLILLIVIYGPIRAILWIISYPISWAGLWLIDKWDTLFQVTYIEEEPPSA